MDLTLSLQSAVAAGGLLKGEVVLVVNERPNDSIVSLGALRTLGTFSVTVLGKCQYDSRHLAVTHSENPISSGEFVFLRSATTHTNVPITIVSNCETPISDGRRPYRIYSVQYEFETKLPLNLPSTYIGSSASFTYGIEVLWTPNFSYGKHPDTMFFPFTLMGPQACILSGEVILCDAPAMVMCEVIDESLRLTQYVKEDLNSVFVLPGSIEEDVLLSDLHTHTFPDSPIQESILLTGKTYTVSEKDHVFNLYLQRDIFLPGDEVHGVFVFKESKVHCFKIFFSLCRVEQVNDMFSISSLPSKCQKVFDHNELITRHTVSGSFVLCIPSVHSASGVCHSLTSDLLNVSWVLKFELYILDDSTEALINDHPLCGDLDPNQISTLSWEVPISILPVPEHDIDTSSRKVKAFTCV